ncbi:phosphodiesterase [Protaetiibacter mangrovi]|uniref:Phosphodiesterase n=1 Tax=Protaetiibacter mangrovi TaxID=2970926 RepID=A0ABT1ZIF6_9MICO|nr:phosphodiesterase [Protaetiibacter mangrovi]MCS0500468.1 phosphodiesterase [Protaetiibacter mangrovi]
MVQLGQHAPPVHVVAHISDTHLLGGGKPLYGAVDTEATVARAFAQLERSGARPEAIVITGDLADLGEPDAYLRLKAHVEPAAERMGSRVIWVMGNHDEREPFAELLMGEEPTNAPQDRVHDVNGLRIIALDSTVPGYHHGDLDPAQLAWLREQLSTPAPHGTLLALHHPPIPTPVELMAVLELDHQAELADVVRGSDVRAVLAGHLHYSTTGTFAGVPVSVASATCYTIDTSAEPGTLAGIDGGQTFNLVHVYDDQVVHSIVPVGDARRVAGFSGAFLDALAEMTPTERREAFSNKRSTFNLEDHLRAQGS